MICSSVVAKDVSCEHSAIWIEECMVWFIPPYLEQDYKWKYSNGYVTIMDGKAKVYSCVEPSGCEVYGCIWR